MAKFEPDKFMTMFKLEPSKDKIDALLRPALYELGKHLNLMVITKDRKPELKQMVLEYLVSTDLYFLNLRHA